MSEVRRGPVHRQWQEAPFASMRSAAVVLTTVPELAALSGLSRAAFARAFQQTLGQAPMQYLFEWRTTLAREHLRSGDLTLTQIAQRTGYTSPYAFAAAFRRHHGEPPGRWRQHAGESVDASSARAAIH